MRSLGAAHAEVLSRSLTARWLFGGVVAILLLAALHSSSLILRRQDALSSISRYVGTWLCSQGAVEIARMEAVVAASGLPGSGVDRAAVQLRLDILTSRVETLRHGNGAALMRANQDFSDLPERMAQMLATAQPMVDHLEEPGMRPRLLVLLHPFALQLQRLAAAVYDRDIRTVGENVASLASLYRQFSVILLALFGAAFGLVILVIWHNRMLHAAQAEVNQLLVSLRRTSGELATAHDQVRSTMLDVQRQVTSMEQRDAEVNLQNARFDAALNNMSQALCMVDAERRLIVCNARFVELFGLPPALALPGTPIEAVFQAIGEQGPYEPRLIREVALEQLNPDHGAKTFQREANDGRAVAVSHRPMAGGGWVATYEDVTERRLVEARIRFMALHDGLTGLANRRLFRERMEQAVQRPGEGVAVLCLDLDRFKAVNDTLGHAAGDMLLREVTRRLRDSTRSHDLVARLGGDEFAILQTSVRQPEHADALAARLVRVMKQPFELNGQQATIGVSIGIAITQEEESNAEVMLKNADLALYRAKAEGRNTHCFFAPEMDEAIQARRRIELRLRDAVRTRSLEVEYQPLLEIHSLRPRGFEALLRWRDPELGSIPPSDFIPVAEELGLIHELGEWVLQQACAEASSWPAHLQVAVNLSPMQFNSHRLHDSVLEALRRSGLSPGRLELEITESALLGDSKAVLQALHALRRHGVRIALDDFGTGYSALSYLRQFPFDKIKIDRSFVRDLTTHADCLAIVTSILDLATKLGMMTTAEGVETEEQLEQLADAGCTEVQGHLFARAAPTYALGRWLDQLPPDPSFTAAPQEAFGRTG